MDEDQQNKQSRDSFTFGGARIAIEVGVGTAIGVATNNIGAGMGIVVAIGVAVGATISTRR